ncbi:hypothetical protein ACO22_05034 [Paracoccidioides brasiliensis]|uniref:RTA1 domain-containing protein n=1 Tax=Paracoccidioides brasiliensis TaxID=121759 RepID=A0A1D2JBD4_PARBR|nr:hypothetical protein ACO22_05034 [Paracoccidioides brasiliensis]
MNKPGTEGFSYFQYKPVKGVPTVFAVIWFISGGLHLWQNNMKYKTWRMGILLPWICVVFAIGYVLREVAAHGHYGNLDLFISTAVFLFCAPPIYLAIISIIFGRLLYYVPWLSPIHPGRVMSTFLGLDLIVETLASSGAPLATNYGNSKTKVHIGNIMIKASIILQIPIFISFFLLVAFFHRRLHRADIRDLKIRKVLINLYLACCLVTVRNVFRAFDTFAGWGSAMGPVEAYFWCFDGVPMLIVTAMMNVYPPASCLPRSHVTYLARDGKTELSGPGWIDDRPFLVTIFDPFDIAGSIKGRDKKTAFWEEDGVLLNERPKTQQSSS